MRSEFRTGCISRGEERKPLRPRRIASSLSLRPYRVAIADGILNQNGWFEVEPLAGENPKTVRLLSERAAEAFHARIAWQPESTDHQMIGDIQIMKCRSKWYPKCY